ncbi:uncharacterized protein LOC144446076 [Glandiceps talaboti]
MATIGGKMKSICIMLMVTIVTTSASSGDVVYTEITSDQSHVSLGEEFAVFAEVVVNAGTQTSCEITVYSEHITFNVSTISYSGALNTSDDTVTYYDDTRMVFITFGNVDNTAGGSNENISVVFNAVMSYSSSMGSNIGIAMEVEYDDTYSMIANTSVQFSGPETSSSYTSDQDVVYGSMPIDKEQEAAVEITLPMDTLNNVELIMTFESTDLSTIPVDMTAAYLEYDDTLYNLTLPATNITDVVKDVTNDTASRRRKRATGSETSFTWPIGSITNDGPSNGQLIIAMYYVMKGTPEMVSGSLLDYTLTMKLNGGTAIMEKISGMSFSEPDLSVDATSEALYETRESGDYTMELIRFNVTVEHSTNSLADAYSVELTFPVDGLEVLLYDEMYPPFGTPGLTYSKNNRQIKLTENSVAVGATMYLTFKAFFSDTTLKYNYGVPSVYTVTTTYDSLDASLKTPTYPGRSYTASDTACIEKNEQEDVSYLYNAGAGAIAFFVALLIAAVLVALFILCWIKVLKKNIPFASVEPDKSTYTSSKGRGLIMNAKDAYKTGFNTIKESSLIAIDESIIYILMLKDKLQLNRELDNLDVLSTITVDIELEIQRIEMMSESILLLIQSLRANKDISKSTEDKCIGKYQRNCKDLNKRLSDEYKQESAKLIKRLSEQNKGKLTQLHKKHKAEKKAAETQTVNMPEEERKAIMDLIEKQHQAEENEITHLLKLEQDEEQEKLRKEFAIRKRMAVKALQHTLLADVKGQGKLTEEQADWLMKQHKKNMNVIEKFMDDEISRQRMLLDEKLARRRALAASKEDQEDYHRDLLNTMATQQMDVIKTMTKDEKLREEEAAEYFERIRKDLVNMKQKFDSEQKKQEDGLHKRLSELKKRRIEQKEREHKQELLEFEKKQKVKAQNSHIDPQGYIEGKEHLLSQQRSEMNELENQLDEEAAKELEQTREQLVIKVKNDIKSSGDKLYKDLGNKGLDEELKDEIMAQHERDLENLLEVREDERAKQEKILKKRLAKNRKEWARRKEEEKEEQQKIREHEEQMIGRLMATQMVMSDADRDKILQEHEKQLVKLENSLTLNKLRQKRKLEEKLAAKKTKQLEKLEKKHAQETQRQKRRQEMADSENEDDFASAEQEMMKRHAEEKIGLLTSEKSKQDDELEQVRNEMMEERAKALKDQEERLGAMVAKLQMEKARELATIEEQQKALNNLKMNMMDELTDNGIISNPEGRKIIEEHQKEVEKLEGKLNAQRQSQEKELKRRLRDKLAQREKSFMHMQDEELRQAVDGEKNKMAAKLRRAALKHKQMMELEEFRRKMEVEIGQALEDLRRSYEVRRLQLLQEQEFEFLSGLIKHGGYQKSELQSILLLLFPNKSDKQINELLDKMYKRDGAETEEDEKEASSRKSKKLKKGAEVVPLEERIKTTLIQDIPDTPDLKRMKKGSLKVKKSKKNKLAPLKKAHFKETDDEEDEEAFRRSKLPSIPSKRPEPVGRTATPDDDTERGRYAYGNYVDSEDEIDDYFQLSSRPVPRRVMPAPRADYSY